MTTKLKNVYYVVILQIEKRHLIELTFAYKLAVPQNNTFNLLSCRNYVVTHIIEMKVPNFSAKLISKFKGNYVNLSMQKFSSHVVESCLKHVGESRSRIVRELLSAPHFEQLLQDPYANYVVQCALEVTKVWNFLYINI